MPVSISSAGAALHDALTTTFSSIKSDESFNSELSGSAKQVLLTKIEYEETCTFKSSQESLKSKYIYLRANCNGIVNSSNSSSSSNNNKNYQLSVPERENRPNLSSGGYFYKFL